VDGAPLDVAQLVTRRPESPESVDNQPDATEISAFPSDLPTQQQPPSPVRPRNMGRNAIRHADLSLARNICIHESHALNLRFEAFSAANHPNWDSPGSDARKPLHHSA
jgi:hypothetical protein